MAQADTDTGRTPRPGPGPRREPGSGPGPGRRRRPRLPGRPVHRLTALAVLVAALLAFPSAVPNTAGHLGSLLETFLPWLGLAVPLLLGLALLRRSAVAALALLLPAAAWLGQVGGLLVPAGADGPGSEGSGGGRTEIVAVQHNVGDDNPDPAGTARALAAARADLIALEELTPSALPAFTAALATDYPHHATHGTVGLWSKYPLTDVRPVDIRPAGLGPDWNRALRASATTPRGPVAVYVAHLPSLRLGPSGLGSGRRDASAVLLGAVLAAEPADRVVLLGDLNSTVDDRGLDPVRASRLNAPESGFAFSWPASFPLARIDQVLARSGTVTAIRTLPATRSDHLPVRAVIRFG
ncbi:endonuclease/exonuclease/phosphatase family protein [Streptomyces sp. ISL-66]|uniref:endonuclease/exonuclease/phosphatase family protein n=1 Tax=Streptomyces sp. ISL-66 TaxID=2819186 RepID=UPI001BE61316|nr:endonuclease/exonuclease/phosphatase family protein [Streptomyces sp. ISL-66]MBT2466876.1 endonuclease/exonuclease/phosphatase family protein [Streptomyces sp. ISL-66]